MIAPARTFSPAKTLTPSRLAAESRPFLEEPSPFLCAMRAYSFFPALAAALPAALPATDSTRMRESSDR